MPVTAIDDSQPLDKSLEPLNSPIIVIVGSFPQDSSDQIRSVFQRAIVPAASDVNAVIVDDAQPAGCAATAAAAALDQTDAARLLGIIEHGRDHAAIEQNHTDIFQMPATWNNYPKARFQVIARLLGESSMSKRVVVLLFGGDNDDARFLVQCARECWPVIVVGKTGGLADQIVAANANSPDGKPISDPNLREIVETGTLAIASLDWSMDAFRRQILARIDKSSALETVKEAWARFDELDTTALREQKLFRRIELALIVLAVLAAFVAILSNVLKEPFYLHIAVIVVPILISIVGAYNSHFRNGNKWILFRGSAEALKREIYRFRGKSGIYSDEQCIQASRESALAAKVKDILSALEQSEVNKTSLRTKSKSSEHSTSFLTPDDYITERIQDQIIYLTSKTRILSRKLIALQLCIYIVGGVGTLLAAIKLDVWVALATAVVTAFATKLQADQTENSLTQYNQTLVSLLNIVSWWNGLSRWEKSRRKNIDVLIDQTEKALEHETAGWVQQMQAALDKLTEKESSAKQ